MNPPVLPRLGAACGALFAIGLFAAAGDGSQSYSAPREIAANIALALALVFVAFVASRLRDGEGPGGWLATAAGVAGVGGIVIKITSGVPELVAHQVAADGQLAATLSQIANSTTVLSLAPLAMFCAATAIVALRTRALPRWLGAFAAVTAVALVVNAAFLTSAAVPAFLLFLLWTLTASIYLLARPVRQPVPVPVAQPA